MNIRGISVALGLAAAASFASATTLESSNFDSDTDGWTAINGVVGYKWVATGGQSGGYVDALDSGEGVVWVWQAPSNYLGNMSSAYGGTLSYYLKVSTTDAPFVTPLPDVELIGNGMSLVIDAGANPLTTWTGYSVDLVAGDWKIDTLSGATATAAQLQGVLGSLTSIYIRGEFSGDLDVGSLDTVALTAAPVPEPESYALMLGGLAMVGFLARRRSRRR